MCLHGLLQGQLYLLPFFNSTFWDITPCSPLKFNRCFGETCSLHLQEPPEKENIAVTLMFLWAGSEFHLLPLTHGSE
jgi:hypothetical protein